MTATPLQVAQMAAVIANGGFLYRPTIIHHMTDEDGNVVFVDENSQIVARAIRDRRPYRHWTPMAIRLMIQHLYSTLMQTGTTFSNQKWLMRWALIGNICSRSGRDAVGQYAHQR